MKTKILPSPFRSLGFGIFLGLAVISLARAQTSALPAPQLSGPAKVRIIVEENNDSSLNGGSGQTTGSAVKPATPSPAAPTGKSTPARAVAVAAEMKSYTKTSSKTFSISVMNLTQNRMDVVVKTNVLGKDEAGKHEVLTEKTLENKLTLLPGRADSFTTEEVVFTHTTAHRGPAPRSTGTSKKGGPIAPMEPASGHAYFGYRVEVYQGSDLVGTLVSETH